MKNKVKRIVAGSIALYLLTSASAGWAMCSKNLGLFGKDGYHEVITEIRVYDGICEIHARGGAFLDDGP